MTTGGRAAPCAAPSAIGVLLALALGSSPGPVGPAPGAAGGIHFDLGPQRARSFDDSTSIRLDLDGDGRGDRLTPRILTLRRAFIPGAAPFPGGDIERFVAFALDTAAGRSVGTVLQYRFGTENGGYEGFVLDAIGDADGDGRTDLAFHVGGDLPAETIVLLDRGERFAARSSGVLRCACAVDERLQIVARERDGERRVLARWDGGRERFVGDEVVWVIGASAALRDGPRQGSAVVAQVAGGTALRRLAPADPEAFAAGWLAVALDDRGGWISRRVVAAASPEPVD